jgi:transposase
VKALRQTPKRKSVVARLDVADTKTRNEKLIAAKRAIQQGQGYEAAAQILGVSLRWVKSLAWRGDLPVSKRPGFAKRRFIDRAAVEADFTAGMSTTKIAVKHGRTETVIRAWRRDWTTQKEKGLE